MRSPLPVGLAVAAMATIAALPAPATAAAGDIQAFSGTLTAPAIAAPPPPGALAGLDDPVRHALARRLDDEITVATNMHRHGIVAVRVNDVPAVVVARDATLADVRASVPAAVREPRPGVWELDRLLVVTRGATLTIAAPRVRQLRLLSSGPRFATLVAQNASLRFAGRLGDNLVVRSWDPALRAADATLEDGRGSVSVRGAGRLDAHDTSFADLGFTVGRASGVAASSPRIASASVLAAAATRSPAAAAAAIAATDPPPRLRPTGALVRSKFERNVFGAYSYEATAMRFADDQFLDNLVYGLDPHDNSDGFLVEGNLAAGNGRHGIIFSRFCDNNVIRGNRSVDNGWHGIVLDDGKAADGPSDHNVVANNVVIDNRRVGISIDGSSDNIVSANQISGQRYGVRVLRNSVANVLHGNHIVRSTDYGVLINGGSATRVHANVVDGAVTGARLDDAPGTIVSDNTLRAVRRHGVEVIGAAGPVSARTAITGNAITGSGTSPILAQVDDEVLMAGNHAHWRYPFLHTLGRDLSWFVGPGLWLLLALAAALGPLPRRILRAWA